MVYEIELGLINKALVMLMARLPAENGPELADAIDHLGAAREALGGVEQCTDCGALMNEPDHFNASHCPRVRRQPTDIINAVVVEMIKRAYTAYHEYPGCVHIVVNYSEAGFWTSDQNDTWTVDIQTPNEGTIQTWDTLVPNTETDATVIADAIVKVIDEAGDVQRMVVDYRQEQAYDRASREEIDIKHLKDVLSRTLSVMDTQELDGGAGETIRECNSELYDEIAAILKKL